MHRAVPARFCQLVPKIPHLSRRNSSQACDIFRVTSNEGCLHSERSTGLGDRLVRNLAASVRARMASRVSGSPSDAPFLDRGEPFGC